MLTKKTNIAFPTLTKASNKQTNKPRENKGDTKHKLHHSFFVLQKVKKAYAKEDVPIV